MDLTSVTSEEIGSTLDRAGMSWNYDDDGDIRIRFRSSQHTDVVFYEFDAAKADFSMRGQFLDARATPQSNGTTQWEVPRDGHPPTAVAQKVVTVYLMPRSGGVRAQIHASIAPLDQPRPMHIKIIPGSQQVSRIETAFPGAAGAGDGKQFWMSRGVTGTQVEEGDFLDFIYTSFQVGLDMFDGPFTGWMFSTDVQ